MSIVRKVKRNKFKRAYKEYYKGLSKKNRPEFKAVWKTNKDKF